MREQRTAGRARLLGSTLERLLLVGFAPPAKALRDPTQKCQPYLEAVTKHESNINGVGPRKRKRTTLRRDLGVPWGGDACKRRAIASLASGAPVSDAAFARKREGETDAAMLQNPVERGGRRNGAALLARWRQPHGRKLWLPQSPFSKRSRGGSWN